jgi:hypothetical protein
MLAGLPPLWRSSSVATGPDFECDDIMSAEQKASGGKVFFLHTLHSTPP